MNARGESEAQVTVYEDPGVTASSVQPGVSQRPEGELQVTNEPVSSAHALEQPVPPVTVERTPAPREAA